MSAETDSRPCPCPGHGATLCLGHSCPCPLHVGGTCDGTLGGES